MNFRIERLGDPTIAAAVEQRWNSLTKPPGSLGRLESLILQLALIQGTPQPRVSRKAMAVFCADHGVTDEGISAYPKEVTAQMVSNFVAGGAAITVLARKLGMTPIIVDAGVAGAAAQPGTVDLRIAPGTANMARRRAMSIEQAERALANGRGLAMEVAREHDIAAVGEMGIGNTTSASALLCAVAGVAPNIAAGPGTGLSAEGVAHKEEVIRRALALHSGARDPMSQLACFGGFEIATMAGFLLGAAEARMPVVVDGFISSSAALVACAMEPELCGYLIFSHVSAEPAHGIMLNRLGAKALLSLDMRLGEGSGAALAMPILDAAHALYTGMATFGEAGVSG